MPLTDAEIRNANPSAKHVRIFDGHGLYMEVSPAGGKLWRLKYRFDGKEKRLALGAYPVISLASARDQRDQARQLLAQGIDPGKVRREEKAREGAAHLAAKDASTVKVSASLDGTVEIWKGRAVMCLSPDDARAVKVLLIKLTA